MARLNSHLTASYIDVAGDDPALDWFVVRDDYTDQEASFPVTRLPELITATNSDTGVLTLAGESFMGGPAQTVYLPGHLRPVLSDVLTYFNEGATAPTRPDVEVHSFDNTDDLLAFLGVTDTPLGDA